MSLQSIDIPDTISQLPHSPTAVSLIELVYDRIESFMLTDEPVSENFVPCDFHLLDQSLTWIEQNHLLSGNRFCEFGSGFGAAALLTSLRGMESVGIEIEPVLVDQSVDLADELGSTAKFYCGSFIPRGISGMMEFSRDVQHVDIHEGDVYEEIGLGLDDFDLFFAFPWPGEHHFFERVFQAGAARSSLLLSYHGREGMQLVRKA